MLQHEQKSFRSRSTIAVLSMFLLFESYIFPEKDTSQRSNAIPRKRRPVSSIFNELGPLYTRRAYRMPENDFWLNRSKPHIFDPFIPYFVFKHAFQSFLHYEFVYHIEIVQSIIPLRLMLLTRFGASRRNPHYSSLRYCSTKLERNFLQKTWRQKLASAQGCVWCSISLEYYLWWQLTPFWASNKTNLWRCQDQEYYL
jgi:hypothetical protein